ncbi:hypothetical protein [Streptomyces clavifer]|uniref:hypothetical protein n=1 Tax=Streptomyces clavifer TaxID=68188 RepID=UPI0033B11323
MTTILPPTTDNAPDPHSPHRSQEARTAGGAPLDRLLLTQVRDHPRRFAPVSRAEAEAGRGTEAEERVRALVTARERRPAGPEDLPGAGG